MKEKKTTLLGMGALDWFTGRAPRRLWKRPLFVIGTPFQGRFGAQRRIRQRVSGSEQYKHVAVPEKLFGRLLETTGFHGQLSAPIFARCTPRNFGDVP